MTSTRYLLFLTQVLIVATPCFAADPDWAKIKDVLDRAKRNPTQAVTPETKSQPLPVPTSAGSNAPRAFPTQTPIRKDELGDFDAFKDQNKNTQQVKIVEDAIIKDATTNVNISDDQMFYPKDQRFWDYKRDIEKRSILSVIIDGRDPQHVQLTINKWISACQKKGAIPGDILIIKPEQKLNENETRAVEETNYNIPNVSDPDINEELVKKAIDKYDLTFSPTWIVRSEGDDYIFQGKYDPEKFFE